MDTETKAKAKDNNRRLAALESGVSALAIALTANGITIPEGADPIEAAIAAIKGAGALEAELHNLAGYASGTIGRIVPDLDLAPQTGERPFAYLERLTLAANPRIDELIAAKGANADLAEARDQLHTASGKVAELEARLEALGTPGTDAAELEDLHKRVLELTAEVGELEQDLADVTEAKNTLANQLAADGKGNAPAPPAAPVDVAPAVPETERAAGARDAGKAFGSLTEVAIGALRDDGGPFEIVFSNGEFELVEFGPIVISGKDLTRVDSSRFIVDKAISIRGAGTPARIHGAALFYADEQVGYCTFEPSLVIQPGQERRFDRALIFG